MSQADLNAEDLARWLQGVNRDELLQRAEAAYDMKKTDATAQVVAACEELVR